jgi:YD repeat-containing protein
MTEESDGKTTVTTYDYYADKANKLINNNIAALFIGKPNANLVKTETVDGVLSNSYAYDYDSKSNPTKQTATDSNGVKNIFVYSWSCK